MPAGGRTADSTGDGTTGGVGGADDPTPEPSGFEGNGVSETASVAGSAGGTEAEDEESALELARLPLPLPATGGLPLPRVPLPDISAHFNQTNLARVFI